MFYFQIMVLLMLFHDSLTELNTAKYKELPPLFALHNYDDCTLLEHSKYCLLYAEINPDPDSQLWLKIQQISRDSMHYFRHDILFFGACDEQCREILQDSEYLKSKQTSVFSSGSRKNLTNEIIEYYKIIHNEDENHRLNDDDHNVFLENCVNTGFQKIYNLSVTTFTEYCDSKPNQSQQNGYLQTIFISAIAIVVALNIFSTAYDIVLSKKQQQCSPGTNNSNEELNKASTSIFMSFSLCRNFKRLTEPSANEHNDLQFTYSFRVFTMFIVIFGHVLMVTTSVPVENTEFIESYFGQAKSIIFQNGSAIIQIFFVLSGFWLNYNFNQKRLLNPNSSISKSLCVYIVYFIDRYLRFLPSLLILMFFNSTLLMHLADGPVWKHISEGERVLCSKFWWKNILMINNFLMKNSCAHHTWYLAADMQLYELFLTIAIFTAVKPQSKSVIYLITGVMSFLIPGFLTYFYSLDAFPYLKPESYRFFYFKDVDTFYTTYPQFYCNLGGYLVGFVCADIYLKYIRGGATRLVTLKYRRNLKIQIPLVILIFSIAFGLLFSGLLVMDQSGSHEASLKYALYAAFYRNSWAILGGLTLIAMLLKFGSIAYDVACLPLFQVLGRLTFQIYIWHTTIIRLLIGFYRQPVYINEFYVICQTLLAFILTTLVAFVIALFLDFPLGHLLKASLQKAKDKLYR